MQVEAVYSHAVAQYDAGQYEEARDLFTLLSAECPGEPTVWKGVAACYQAQKSYHEALLAWGVASLLDPHDPLPAFHSAECLLAQGEALEAKKAVQHALSLPCSEEQLEQMVQLKEKILHSLAEGVTSHGCC